MPKKPTNNDASNSHEIDQKFPGLSEKKPAKSISVERPVDSDEKTVTETGLDPDKAASARSLKPDRGSQISKSAENPGDGKHHGRGKGSRAEKPETESDTIDPEAPADDDADETVLELPPSPKQRRAKRRRIIWISVLSVAVLVIGGWAVLFFSPILAIEEIHHEGLDLVTESEAVERTAGLEGTPLPQVGESGVTELFENIPAVKDVTLRAEPPHGLVVTVQEHQPIAMSPRDKQYVVFSKDGTELAEITSQKAQEFDLPVVASAADVADEDVFSAITEVLGSLPDELRNQVRSASGSSIDSIELELASGKTIMWGNTEQTDKKAKVMEALLDLDEEEAAGISEYDVSAPDFPVTR